ncbi:MAG: tRNA epoxyqueuosine(34) reductase QueG [Candidatus Zixiibacteriota bacterium]|nr:MAG: tRNA epoxyqueuosine(34) reductase QueG [candidate division Zixibacteria bacterium]
MLNAEQIRKAALDMGADAVGIAEVHSVQNTHHFLKWLGDGYAGDMTYLARYMDERFDPGKLLPGARSIIVLGLNYYPASGDLNKMKGPYKVARYAWGEDYHIILRRRLRRLRGALKKTVPELKGRICVDTAPFMDKYWAQTAGLGWQGKHSNLVSRRFGNWLLIGSLVIDIEVDKYDRPHTDHCGTCTACIDACPTGAIEKPYLVNATRCISYWTIESKASEIPDDIAGSMNYWVFGCDICIEVCPFNRFQKERREKNSARLDSVKLLETGKIVKTPEKKFAEVFRASPINRPKLAGIKRNIAAAG